MTSMESMAAAMTFSITSFQLPRKSPRSLCCELGILGVEHGHGLRTDADHDAATPALRQGVHALQRIAAGVDGAVGGQTRMHRLESDDVSGELRNEQFALRGPKSF